MKGSHRSFRQAVHFVNAPDNVRIAYAVTGSGPPIVKTPNWLTHLEYDYQSPGWLHWLGFLSSRWRLYRCDQRGSGLSDRKATDLSFERWVNDLESMVDAAGLENFTLLGISQGGAVAMEYAARHPDRVARLVLVGAYAQGWARRGDPQEERRGRAMVELIETGWGGNTSAYRQLFTSLFMPEATQEQAAWFNEMQRVSADPETAARLVEAAGNIDVTSSLSKIRAPVLVAHARQDERVPFEQGRRIAAAIPGARLVSLESRNHVLLEQDPAWRAFREAFEEFVPGGARGPAELAPLDELTTREREILVLVVAGLSNAEIASKMSVTVKTVRNHLSNVYSKLGVRTRAQAMVACRDRLR